MKGTQVLPFQFPSTSKRAMVGVEQGSKAGITRIGKCEPDVLHALSQNLHSLKLTSGNEEFQRQQQQYFPSTVTVNARTGPQNKMHKKTIHTAELQVLRNNIHIIKLEQ